MTFCILVLRPDSVGLISHLPLNVGPQSEWIVTFFLHKTFLTFVLVYWVSHIFVIVLSLSGPHISSHQLRNYEPIF